MQSGVADSQIIRNSIKKRLLLVINTFTKFLLFRMKYIIDTYNYFIIPMDKWTYSLIYYLITYIISFYQLSQCF